MVSPLKLPFKVASADAQAKETVLSALQAAKALAPTVTEDALLKERVVKFVMPTHTPAPTKDTLLPKTMLVMTVLFAKRASSPV